MSTSPEAGQNTRESAGRNQDDDNILIITEAKIFCDLFMGDDEALIKFLKIPGNAELSRVVVEEHLEANGGAELSPVKLEKARDDLLRRIGGSTNLQ
jgi:hypothetical protein